MDPVSTSALVASGFGLGLSLWALYIAHTAMRNASFLDSTQHEIRCTRRATDLGDGIKAVERNFSRLQDEIADDLSDAVKERQRAQAANARAGKKEKANGAPGANGAVDIASLTQEELEIHIARGGG